MSRPTSRSDDEGDIAADYIEELLDIADLDGDIEIDARGGRAYLSVIVDRDANSARALAARHGQRAAGAHPSRRADQDRRVLTTRSSTSADRARRAPPSSQRSSIGRDRAHRRRAPNPRLCLPMSSYERKLVHDLVAERGFVSESEGEGRDRHTVITARADVSRETVTDGRSRPSRPLRPPLRRQHRGLAGEFTARPRPSRRGARPDRPARAAPALVAAHPQLRARGAAAAPGAAWATSAAAPDCPDSCSRSLDPMSTSCSSSRWSAASTGSSVRRPRSGSDERRSGPGPAEEARLPRPLDQVTARAVSALAKLDPDRPLPSCDRAASSSS